MQQGRFFFLRGYSLLNGCQHIMSQLIRPPLYLSWQPKKDTRDKKKTNTHTNIYTANLNKLYCMVEIESNVQAFVLILV